MAQLESNVAATELKLRPDEVAALTAAAQDYEPVRGIRAAPGLGAPWSRRPRLA